MVILSSSSLFLFLVSICRILIISSFNQLILLCFGHWVVLLLFCNIIIIFHIFFWDNEIWANFHYLFSSFLDKSELLSCWLYEGCFFVFSFEDCCISVGLNYQKDIAADVEPCDVLNNINWDADNLFKWLFVQIRFTCTFVLICNVHFARKFSWWCVIFHIPPSSTCAERPF